MLNTRMTNVNLRQRTEWDEEA